MQRHPSFTATLALATICVAVGPLAHASAAGGLGQHGDATDVLVRGREPAAASQSVEPPASLRGSWSGTLVRDGAAQWLWLRVDESGARYDIPELGFYDVPLKRLETDGDHVLIEMLYGTFAGVLHPAGREIALVNDQLHPGITLHLKPALAPSMCVSRDVSFTSDVDLAGTILAPPRPGPFPGAVIVHDSGARSRDDRSYRVYAQVLCRQGFAALVYDKRGVGDSGGDFDAASIDDLTRDAVAATEALRRDDLVGASVGMLGFSQGGWIAPLAARRASLDWIALLAGPAVSVWDQELQRVEGEMRRDARPETEIAAALAFTRSVFAAVEDPSLRSGVLESGRHAAAADWSDYVYVPESDSDIESWLLEKYDPAPVLSRITTPTLAIFGADDPRVPPAENLDRMRRYLEAAGNHDFRTIVLDHFPHKIYSGQGYAGDGEAFPERIWRWDRLVPGLFPEVVAFAQAHASLAGGR